MKKKKYNNITVREQMSRQNIGHYGLRDVIYRGHDDNSCF